MEPDISDAEGAQSASEIGQSGTECQENPTKNAREFGSAHRGGQLQSYSLWMRMGITADIRLNGMSPKEACNKW